MYLSKNRPLGIKMFKKVVDEIADTILEDYIYASIKETILRISNYI